MFHVFIRDGEPRNRGHLIANDFPLSPLELNACQAAYAWGRANDAAFLTGAWAPDEHLLRASDGCEFRGLMIRAGFIGAPRQLGKYPRAVILARQRGACIERIFAPLPPDFLNPPRLAATLAQIDARPGEWFAAWRREIGGNRLVLADTIELGGLQ